MGKYRVYLETREDGRSMAHVLALPGCFVKGPNPDATLERVPEAIESYRAWVVSHGETWPMFADGAVAGVSGASETSDGGAGSGAGNAPDEPAEWELVEATRTDAGMESGDKVAIFGPDLLAPTDAELAVYLRVMGHSRADLLALTETLSEAVLNWQPPDNRRTVRKILHHVARAEYWYTSRLCLDLPVEESEDVFRLLAEVRCEAVNCLVAVPFAERARVIVRDELISAWGAGERWTYRKALRRFVEHEREHVESIRAILAEAPQAGG